MFVSLLVFVLFVLEELHSVVGSSTVGDIIKSTDVFLLLPQWCFLLKHTRHRGSGDATVTLAPLRHQRCDNISSTIVINQINQINQITVAAATLHPT